MLLKISRISLVFILIAYANFTQAAKTITVQDNFANGSLGWSADFADYPAGSEEFYELSYAFAKLPAYLAKNRFALNLSGNNHSDDLSMFLRKKVTNLAPNTLYNVTFQITIASNAPKGAFGIGGAPGESVFVKAGVVNKRPAADPSTRRMNIDKGEQSNGGVNAQVIGDLSVNIPVAGNKYRFKRLVNKNPFRYRSNAQGEGWLYFATDSGFEGLTSIYIVGAKYSFVPVK